MTELPPSNGEIPPVNQTKGKRGRSGSKAATTPSTSAKAKPLGQDRPVWERQTDESKAAFDAFLVFRDSEERQPGRQGRAALQWSSVWSWGYRAYEWDLYLARLDDEQAVRYRREMNKRQRASARLAQNKIAQFLMDLDPLKLTPQEAARWYEVAVRIERMAGGDVTERVGVNTTNSPVDQMTAEEVRDALVGIQSEIERLTQTGEPADLP